MEDEEDFWPIIFLEKKIDEKTDSHEKTIGWASGILGIAILLGIFHAFWLLIGSSPLS